VLKGDLVRIKDPLEHEDVGHYVEYFFENSMLIVDIVYEINCIGIEPVVTVTSHGEIHKFPMTDLEVINESARNL